MTHQPDARRMLDDRGYTGALIHNTNPAYLLDAAVRDRITESYYWKEQCFGLNCATLCDRAAEMTCIGGTYGQQKPTPFLCLVLKLLQLLPERDIILEYLHQKEFKYLSALAAFYIRLAWDSKDIYTTLEPKMDDYRKLRRRRREGGWTLTYLDEFIDELLTKDRVCATGLRKLPSRAILEDAEGLDSRVSLLQEEVDELDESEDDRSSERSRDARKRYDSEDDKRSDNSGVVGEKNDSDDDGEIDEGSVNGRGSGHSD